MHSVGPYPLISRVVGPSKLNARRTCGTDRASPPISNCSIPRSACGRSSMTALNSDAVSHSIWTRCRLSSRSSSAKSGTPPGNSTQQPPCSSGPQISSVDASNEIGANCMIRSEASNRA